MFQEIFVSHIYMQIILVYKPYCYFFILACCTLLKYKYRLASSTIIGTQSYYQPVKQNAFGFIKYIEGTGTSLWGFYLFLCLYSCFPFSEPVHMNQNHCVLNSWNYRAHISILVGPFIWLKMIIKLSLTFGNRYNF